MRAESDVRVDRGLADMGPTVMTGAGGVLMDDSVMVMLFVDVALMIMHCSAVASYS